jgi:sialic acid synthase SpsE
MVDAVREAEKALGKVDYSLTENKKNSRLLGRSIFVVKNMKKGEKFSQENIRIIRPGYGLPPKCFGDILGELANKDIGRGTPLRWNMILKE